MNNSLALPRLQRLHNSQSIRMRGAILQITVNNNLPPSAALPSLKQCFIAFFPPICICHPRGPLFDLSPPAPASPGSRWPVDWQLWSDIWWDEASTGAPRRQKQTCGVSPPTPPLPRTGAALPWKRTGPTTRWRKVQANAPSAAPTVSCAWVWQSLFFSQSSFFSYSYLKWDMHLIVGLHYFSWRWFVFILKLFLFLTTLLVAKRISRRMRLILLTFLVTLWPL